jgi:hypothetical protein
MEVRIRKFVAKRLDSSWCPTAFKVIQLDCVGSAVLTAVVMNSTIFCDITFCSPLKVNRRFGVTIASVFRVEQ